MSTKSQFIIIYRPPRATFLDDQTEAESEVIGQHFQYLQQLLHEGKLIMAGRCIDAAFGIAIIEAASESEAQQIMENDPAVQAKVFSSELRPFSTALRR
ncbi:MAG: YciI family protein [Promethearchaeota archaeon]